MDWIEYGISALIVLAGALHILPNDKVEAIGEKIVGRALGWITIATAKAGRYGKLVGFLWNTAAHFLIGVGRALDKRVNDMGNSDKEAGA